MRTIPSPHFPLRDNAKQQYAVGVYRFQFPTPKVNKVTNDDTNTIYYMLERIYQERAMVCHTENYGGFV